MNKKDKKIPISLLECFDKDLNNENNYINTDDIIINRHIDDDLSTAKFKTNMENGNNKEEYFSYEDINNISPFNNVKKINLLVEWDDICQFTFFGLFDIISEMLKDDININFDTYLTRPNIMSDQIDVILKIFEGRITREQIIQIKKQNYTRILATSPKAAMHLNILQNADAYKKITYIFPFHNNSILNLIKSIKTELKKNKINTEIDFFIEEDNIGYHNFLKSVKPDVIFSLKSHEVISSIFKCKMKKIQLFTPLEHNGFKNEFLNEYFSKKMIKSKTFMQDHMVLPNSISVFFYNEQIVPPNSLIDYNEDGDIIVKKK